MMEKVILGKTGIEIKRLGFGGIPIQRVDERPSEAWAEFGQDLDRGRYALLVCPGERVEPQREVVGCFDVPHVRLQQNRCTGVGSQHRESIGACPYRRLTRRSLRRRPSRRYGRDKGRRVGSSRHAWAPTLSTFLALTRLEN